MVNFDRTLWIVELWFHNTEQWFFTIQNSVRTKIRRNNFARFQWNSEQYIIPSDVITRNFRDICFKRMEKIPQELRRYTEFCRNSYINALTFCCLSEALLERLFITSTQAILGAVGWKYCYCLWLHWFKTLRRIW